MQIKQTSLMEAVSFWRRERTTYIDLCILKEYGWEGEDLDVWEQQYRLFAFPGVLCIHLPSPDNSLGWPFVGQSLFSVSGWGGDHPALDEDHVRPQ